MIEKCKGGGITQIWSSRNSQGYEWRQFGAVSREFVDIEGLYLTSMASKGKRVEVSLRPPKRERQSRVEKAKGS